MGLKCSLKRGCLSSQAFTSGVLRVAFSGKTIRKRFDPPDQITVSDVSDPLISPVSAVLRVCQNGFVVGWRFRWWTVGMDLLGVARFWNLGAGTGGGLTT
jgi:hypothetical protein